MSKFKIGNKVRIKEDLELGKMYGNASVKKDMLEYCGKVATIKRVDSDGDYKINLDSEYAYWTNKMLEDEVVEEKDLNYTTLKVGDKVRIRKDLELDKQYVFYVNEDMYSYRGQEATIVDAIESSCFNNCIKFNLDIDGRRWNWSEYMLEPQVGIVNVKDCYNELFDVLRLIKAKDFFISKNKEIALVCDDEGEVKVIGVPYTDLKLDMEFQKMQPISLKELLIPENVDQKVIALFEDDMPIELTVDDILDLIDEYGDNIAEIKTLDDIINGTYLVKA